MTSHTDTGAGVNRDIAVACRNLVKTFGRGASRITALDRVSLEIGQNAFFTLLGPSGCGKTTLLRLIAGFELPDAGHVLLEGREIAHLPPHQRPVNTVFQSYALFPHLTVAENIAFGLEMLGRDRSDIDRTVKRMLALVKLEDLAARRPEQLSGGQQQRVALARALAPSPQVLLLDEPLAALDLKLRKEMQGELKRLQHETGITFIFVTHDQEEALTMSDRIAVMSQGRVRQVGSPHEIYHAPVNRFVADFIGDINILTGRVLRAEAGRVQVELPGGARIVVKSGSASTGDAVTLAVRPERAETAAPEPGMLTGTVERVVFFGAGANIHLTLEDGTAFTVRRQDDGRDCAPGQRIGIRLPDGAVTALEAE